MLFHSDCVICFKLCLLCGPAGHQMLCDLLTMKEASGKRWKDISFAYLGDARFNTGNSLLLVGAKMGMDVRIGAPKAYWPSQELIDMCREFAKASGARITITEDPEAAVKGVDFIHTDIWVSMGEPKEVWDERIEALLPYQVNKKLMEASGRRRWSFSSVIWSGMSSGQGRFTA